MGGRGGLGFYREEEEDGRRSGVVDWKFPPWKEKGFLFLGFVAAARNKKMQWKCKGKRRRLSVNCYSILFRDLSDAAFFRFVQSIA